MQMNRQVKGWDGPHACFLMLHRHSRRKWNRMGPPLSRCTKKQASMNCSLVLVAIASLKSLTSFSSEPPIPNHEYKSTSEKSVSATSG